MTEEQFKSRSFKYFMAYEYVNPRNGLMMPCLLLAVDFDNGLLKLSPIPNDFITVGNDDEDFWCRYEYCELPKQRLKAI